MQGGRVATKILPLIITQRARCLVYYVYGMCLPEVAEGPAAAATGDDGLVSTTAGCGSACRGEAAVSGSVCCVPSLLRCNTAWAAAWAWTGRPKRFFTCVLPSFTSPWAGGLDPVRGAGRGEGGLDNGGGGGALCWTPSWTPRVRRFLCPLAVMSIRISSDMAITQIPATVKQDKVHAQHDVDLGLLRLLL